MTLQQLLYAVKTADLKSMNKAAAECHVSQPALSSSILGLEEEIGIELFLRSNRGISVTAEGREFLRYARQMVQLSQLMEGQFVEKKPAKKQFSVAMQHYSFAVDAFIKLAEEYGMEEYEFAIHETRTSEVIDQVGEFRSEIGVLYTSAFNEQVLTRSFREKELVFTKLYTCGIVAYLSEKHPLAKRGSIALEELSPYPCLSFDQGDQNSFYYSEEVLSQYTYSQRIKADDRATILNLLDGLNGYILCSGITDNVLNGSGYVSVPLQDERVMEIGYLKKRDIPLSPPAERYVELLQEYAEQVPVPAGT